MWLNPGDARQCKIGMPCSWAMLEPVNDIYGPSPFFGDNKYFTSFPHLEYGIFCEVVYGNICLKALPWLSQNSAWGKDYN